MLARSGHEVHFLVRRSAEEIRRRGWIVESVWGDFSVADPLVATDPADVGPCDLIIVALKSTGNENLPDLVQPLVGPQSIALVLQNGLEVEEATAALMPAGQTLGGCCFLCSNLVGPGHVRHLDYGRIEAGVYEGPGAKADGFDREEARSRLKSVVACLADAGIPATAADRLADSRWRKLMWNIPFNGLSVAIDAATDAIMVDAAARELAAAIMSEVYAGATACGCDIAAEHHAAMMEHTEQMVPYDSSMRLDYLAHRPMELEYIYARPLRAAKAAGREMPRVEMLYQQLQFLERRNLSQAKSS